MFSRFFALILLVFGLFGCKNETAPTAAKPLSTAEELQLLREKLEKKSSELQDKQQIAEVERQLREIQNSIDKMDGIAPKTAPAAAQPVPAPTRSGKYKINATSVVMRGGSSVQAEKLGTFNLNEVVEVVSIVDAENPNESILREDLELSANGQSIVLPAGKAVMVEKYDQLKDVATVAYVHSTKGKLFAEVSGEALDLISFSRWYQIKRTTGEKGWVFGKFLSPL